MEKLITWFIQANLAGKTWCLRLVANCQFLLNRTIPIRLSYAHDRALYALACDEEACDHLCITPSKIWQVRCFITGFVDGLTTYNIPEWFVDHWFSQKHLQSFGE